MGRALRIGLMGPFGYGNIADEALIDATIANLGARAPDTQFVAYTLDPTATSARHGIPAHPLSRMTPSINRRRSALLDRCKESRHRLLRTLERVARRAPVEVGMLADAYRAVGDVDAMVMCGSGQIQDYWCGGGPFSYPYTTLRWAGLCRLRKVPFLVVSVGAGPVDSRLSARFYRWSLSISAYRSFRDRWSRDYVADVVRFDRDDPVVADLAFSLPPPTEVPTTSDRGDEARADVDARPSRLVGIGPIGYFRQGSWPDVDEATWHRYRSEVVDVVSELVERGDRVVFLKGEGVHDQPVVDEICAEVAKRSTSAERGMLETSVTCVGDLVAVLARCDAVIAARYHNVLFAYIVDRPLVGISYQTKTDALMDRYAEHESCIDIASLDAEEVLSLLDKALTRDRSHRAEVTASQRRLLQDQFDRIHQLIEETVDQGRRVDGAHAAHRR